MRLLKRSHLQLPFAMFLNSPPVTGSFSVEPMPKLVLDSDYFAREMPYRVSEVVATVDVAEECAHAPHRDICDYPAPESQCWAASSTSGAVPDPASGQFVLGRETLQ